MGVVKLTNDQLFELWSAISWGKREVEWARMSEEQRQAQAAAQQQADRELLEQSSHRPAEWRRELQENIELAGDPAALERRERERYYNRSDQQRGKGKSGLKAGINDMLHLFDQGYFHLDIWEAVDRRLAAHGLPSLDQIIDQFSGRHLKMLKRGRIRNDEEYYLVQNLLGDLTSDLTDEQRIALERMSLEFGQRRKA